MATVVVGYVPKPEGAAALERGIQEAELRGLKLVVVSSHRGGSGYDEKTALEQEAALEEVRARLESSGVSYDVRQLVRGLEVVDDVVSVAEANEAELIVIGLRKRSPVGKLVLGSNAQRILLDAHCPVLAVKAK